MVAGNAPDAQILVMKVFGQNGGAFDSDIMAAMEDAIVLGADAVNLSLGSSTAGSAKSPEDEYQRIMENLVECGTVSATSAGNSGHWGENATYGALYADGGVNFDTAGSPGSTPIPSRWLLWTTTDSSAPVCRWATGPLATPRGR